MSEMLVMLNRIAEALERNSDVDASLTTEQAGKFLKVSASTILRYTRVGLPCYRTKGHGITFTKRDLIEFRERFKEVMQVKGRLKIINIGK